MVSETLKDSSPDNDDSGNEADSESEGDTPATLVGEPIVACFNNPQCNTPSEDDDEWVIMTMFPLIIMQVSNYLNLL